MEIQKIFSSYDDYGYEEDRIYSVLMDEDELVLFSEIQREFARKDYEGLTREQQVNLHARRSDYARELNKIRNSSNATLASGNYFKNVGDTVTSNQIIEGGGIRTHNTVRTTRGLALGQEEALKLHNRNLKDQMIRSSKGASKLMKEEVENGIGPKASRESREKANKFLDQMSKPTRNGKKLLVKEGETSGKKLLVKEGETSGKKLSKGLGRKGKVGLAVAGGAALTGLGTAAYLRHHNKKKEN